MSFVFAAFAFLFPLGSYLPWLRQRVLRQYFSSSLTGPADEFAFTYFFFYFGGGLIPLNDVTFAILLLYRNYPGCNWNCFTATRAEATWELVLVLG